MSEPAHHGNFDHMADEYDEKAARIWNFHQKVVEVLQEQTSADQTLLEFGCGTGNVCLSLCPHLEHVYGVDISEKMLAKAREKIQQKSLANATVQHLNLTDPSQLSDIGFPTKYDWVLSCMVLHHLPDPMANLELATSLLKSPQGKLVIVEFATTGEQRHKHHHHHHHHHGHGHNDHHQQTQPPQDQKEHHHEHHHGHEHGHEDAQHPKEKESSHGKEKHHHDRPPHHEHQHAHASQQGDPSRRQELKDQYGIFSDGFNPQSVHMALKTLGLDAFEVKELPPLEGMDKDHPFYGLPIAIMIASRSMTLISLSRESLAFVSREKKAVIDLDSATNFVSHQSFPRAKYSSPWTTVRYATDKQQPVPDRNRRIFWTKKFAQDASVLLGTAALVSLSRPAWAALSGGVSRTEGYAVQKTEAEWRSQLSPVQYDILRRGGTEKPGYSILEKEKRAGEFRCAGCGTPLFASADKFNSGTGWPSFARRLEGVEVEQVNAVVANLAGAELRCATCGGHLGDVFRDGYLFVGTEAFATGERYCIDGAALIFYPADGSDPVRGDLPQTKETPAWLEPPSITPKDKA